MKKYYIVTDIHSFYDKMLSALESCGFDTNNRDHIFVSLGDLLDRGPDPIKCLEFVNNLPKDRKILIRGNHEDLIEELIERKEFWYHDDWNGTTETCYRIFGDGFGFATDEEILDVVHQYEPLNVYLKSCIDYYELGNNIFVHGWLPVHSYAIENGSILSYKEDISDDWKEGDWKKARWYNGMDKWWKGVTLPGKTVYCGHYHCSWGNSNIHNDGKEFIKKIETMYIDPNTGKLEPHVNWEPFKDEGIVAMDACTAVSGKVNCEVIEID